MPKVVIYSEYESEIPLDIEPLVELWQDKFPKKPRDPGTIRILFLCEPPAIKRMHKKLRKRAGEFDHILSFDPWVLKRYAHAHKFVYGTTWAKEMPSTKEFSISSVIGTKLITKGHRLRHQFWKNSERVTNPLKLYFSRQFEEDGIPTAPGCLRLGEDKTPVFESKFHVAIENCRMPDYFTEKIMDCFVTDTIPIYWGCTNIEEYFNPRGMIVCKSLRALVRACNRVTPEQYEEMREAMLENRQRAQAYINIGERLATKIRELVVR